MSRWTKWTMGGAVSLAVLLSATALGGALNASAQTATTQWRAALTGANEVPAKTTAATGTFTATLDETARTLTWTLKVPTIASATMAHIHTGAAGANGPVVVTLWEGGANGFNTVDTYGTAKNTDVTGTLSGDFTGLVSALKAGTLYVNVHTVASPGGEIRAQIAQATATPTATAAATATATPKAATPAPAATVAPAAVPSAPKAGSGGYLDGGSNATRWLLALSAVAAGVTLIGARAMTRRR